MRAVWSVVLLGACSFKHGVSAGDDGPSGSNAIDARVIDSATPGDSAADARMLDAAQDTDGDGVADTADNCPTVANADQADEDQDGVGNVCDNCPHLANANQANSDGDGVGDVCDPNPATTGDHIVLFLPFNNASEITGWSQAGTNASFVVTGGQLAQQGDSDLAIFWNNAVLAKHAWVTTHVNYGTLGSYQFRGVAVMNEFLRPPSFGTGVGCGEMRDNQYMNDTAFYDVVNFNGSGFHNGNLGGSGATVTAGHSAMYTAHADTNDNMSCAVNGTSTGASYVGAYTGTGVNLAVWGAKVTFDYLIVID